MPQSSARILAASRAPLSFEGKSAQNSSLPTKLRFVSEKSGNNRPSSSEKQNQGTIQILGKLSVKDTPSDVRFVFVGIDSVVEIEDMKSVGKYSGV